MSNNKIAPPISQRTARVRQRDEDNNRKSLRAAFWIPIGVSLGLLIWESFFNIVAKAWASPPVQFFEAAVGYFAPTLIASIALALLQQYLYGQYIGLKSGKAPGLIAACSVCSVAYIIFVTLRVIAVLADSFDTDKMLVIPVFGTTFALVMLFRSASRELVYIPFRDKSAVIGHDES